MVDLNLGPYTSDNNQICPWDDDWFAVEMYQGETLYAKLGFTQSNSLQDLDLYVYFNGVNLTGCSEATPSACDPSNGASGTSNESLVWPVPQAGIYYVVVHGWAGSQNSYDICIGLAADECP